MSNATFDLTTARFAVLEAARKAAEVIFANGGTMDSEALAKALGVDMLGAGPTDRLLFELARDTAIEYLAGLPFKKVTRYRKPAISPSEAKRLTSGR